MISIPFNSSPIPAAVISQPSPASILCIIEDAISDPNSAVNNKDHPYRDQAVKSLRRLQLQLFDPSHPIISEVDLKRLNMSVYKAHEMKDNQKWYGTAVGNREKMVDVFIGYDAVQDKPIYERMTKTQFDKEQSVEETCEDCENVMSECDCEWD